VNIGVMSQITFTVLFFVIARNVTNTLAVLSSATITWNIFE